MNGKGIVIFAASALLFTAAAACDQSKPAPSGDQPASPSAAAKTSKPAGGTKHDPPIKPEQVTEGHWYCDMGTVHYSRADKGDGKCPSCGMDLKQKGGAAHGHGSGDGHAH